MPRTPPPAPNDPQPPPEPGLFDTVDAADPTGAPKGGRGSAPSADVLRIRDLIVANGEAGKVCKIACTLDQKKVAGEMVRRAAKQLPDQTRKVSSRHDPHTNILWFGFSDLFPGKRVKA